MKKVIILLVAILTVTFLSSCYSEIDLAEAREEGYAEGYEKGFTNGLSAGYDKGFEKGSSIDNGNDLEDWLSDQLDGTPKLIKPDSGKILSGQEYNESEITITADGSNDYVVLVKDSYEKECVAFFVRAGDTVTVGVPAEELYIYFASGTEWYGYGKGLMFGENTVYSKDDELLDFTEYSWEYILYPVNDGNFSETPSSENEFF